MLEYKDGMLQGFTKTHPLVRDCLENGCAVHNRSERHHVNVEEWRYHWRADRGLLERICPHGIGHPDPDTARYNERTNRQFENVHGCDGCCYTPL